MLINCGNYYNVIAFNKVCKALEQGNSVQVYIDCIGHTRNNYEQETYKEALEKKYHENLMIEKSEGAYSDSYTYRLKYLAVGGKND